MNPSDPEQPAISPLCGPEPSNSSEDGIAETIVTTRLDSMRGGPTVLQGGENPSQIAYFADYEILQELARGGMGVIYKAKQVKLNRLVALKMILTGQLASDEDVKRFHTEAEAAANLDHPGIVPIYEVGEHGGQHYYSMALVEGTNLSAAVAKGPLPPKEAAQLIKVVAEAVACAHDGGVLHRDLKPANILLARVADIRSTAVYLTAEGIEASWYEPKITDFGLAKKTEGDSQLTGTGQILGTPSYMPPEQALGQKEATGPHSDVYSLGAVLYCLLVGHPPFLAANTIDTLLQVIDQEPIPPRALNLNIPRELEAICMKCLEKNPFRRYRSASDLVEDLRRFLEGEPISVRSVNFVDRLVRSLTHNRDDLELRTWGIVLLWFAPLVFLAEVGIYFHALEGPPYPLGWGTVIRCAQFLLMALVLWVYRRDWAGSMKSAGRQMGAIWLGFLFAAHVIVAVTFELQSLQEQREHFEVLDVYPYLAIVSGMALFITGSNYWGVGFLFGLAFFAVAFVMPLWPLGSPLVFGLLWGIALTVIGLRLTRLAREGT